VRLRVERRPASKDNTLPGAFGGIGGISALRKARMKTMSELYGARVAGAAYALGVLKHPPVREPVIRKRRSRGKTEEKEPTTAAES
jgi:hypothetical protein